VPLNDSSRKLLEGASFLSFLIAIFLLFSMLRLQLNACRKDTTYHNSVQNYKNIPKTNNLFRFFFNNLYFPNIYLEVWIIRRIFAAD
jgi:hypothetical protein